MDASCRRLAGFALGAGLLLAGCASTRTGAMGLLPTNERLVTLVISEDRTLVEDHCRGAMAVGPVYGCQITRSSALPDGTAVRLIKIVRFTDSLPSPMAFEIDLHELCHTVATLQTGLADPCHVENHGLLENAPPRTVLKIR
jgi:hypothetical protein